jgi:hypothetical protein
MADLEMYSEIVERVAQALEAASHSTGPAWAAAHGTIQYATSYVGPRGDDRLANAFYSGYSRREQALLEQGRSLPLRFQDRGATGHESARLIKQAEAAATAGMPGN